jgi:FtsZ-interacting cell division protein ZipA
MTLIMLIVCAIVALLSIVLLRRFLHTRDSRVQSYLQWDQDWVGADEVDAILGVDQSATPADDTEELSFQTMYPQQLAALRQALEQPIFSLNILADPKQTFNGYELLQTLHGAGLRYGDMNIFHYQDAGQTYFHVAQVSEPGTIDLDNIGALQCQGLVLFFEFQADGNDAYRLSQLVETALQLADELAGRITLERFEASLDEAVLRYLPALYQA